MAARSASPFPLVVVVTAALLLSCGCRSAPGAHSPSPTITTAPGSVELVAQLYADPAIPPGTAAAERERACAGDALVTIDEGPHALLGLAVAHFEVTLTGCPLGTVVTNVYVGVRGVGAYDDAWIGGNINDTVLPNGSASLRSTNQGIPVERAQAVLASPGDYTIRVNTRNNEFGLLLGTLRSRY